MWNLSKPGEPGVLRPVGSQRAGRDLATESTKSSTLDTSYSHGIPTVCVLRKG